MPQTLFIDTNTLPREATAAGGAVKEILNDRLAGAKNVEGVLRWLAPGERYDAGPLDRHQLLYLMEGAARVTLQGQTHDITQGMGMYLGPSEQATIEGTPGPAAKLFHLVVREVAR